MGVPPEFSKKSLNRHGVTSLSAGCPPEKLLRLVILVSARLMKNYESNIKEIIIPKYKILILYR